MTHTPRTLLILGVIPLIFACSSPISTQEMQALAQGKVRAVREQLPLRNYRFINIDSASSHLASTGTRAQGSQQSESEKLLSKLILTQPCQALAVSGDDDELAARALLQALYTVAGTPGGTPSCPVAFVGKNNAAIEQLPQAARQARVRFDWVEYPLPTKPTP